MKEKNEKGDGGYEKKKTYRHNAQSKYPEILARLVNLSHHEVVLHARRIPPHLLPAGEEEVEADARAEDGPPDEHAAHDLEDEGACAALAVGVELLGDGVDGGAQVPAREAEGRDGELFAVSWLALRSMSTMSSLYRLP